MSDVEHQRLRDLENQFVFGCRNWYVLALWQRYRSFESSNIADRIQVAEGVLAAPHRGDVTWAWTGWGQLLDHLLGCLNDADAHIRQEAAIALGDLRSEALPAVPMLLDRLRSPALAPHDKACAAWALGRIGGPTDEVVQVLLQLLRESADHVETEELRRCAAETIETLTNDPEVLRSLARLCLVDNFYKCRMIGLDLMEHLGQQDSELLLLVERLVHDEVAEVKAVARRILS